MRNKYILWKFSKELVSLQSFYIHNQYFLYKGLVSLQSVFEMTGGNTVETCQKYEIYHEIYNMQLIT